MMLFCNAFNDPSDPWYYIIGVIFLLLVFGALALYVILSKKFAKNSEDAEQNTENSAADNADMPGDRSEARADADSAVENADENSGKPQD